VDEAREILKGWDNTKRDTSILQAFKDRTKLTKAKIFSGNPPTKAEI
jgi:hypothetical protein